MKRLLASMVLLLAAVPAIAGEGWTHSNVRRYYPEPPPPRHYDRPIQGWFELRGGVYNAQDATKNDWTVGIKTVGRVSDNVLIGLSADLQRRQDAGRTITSTYTDPAGNTVTTSSTTNQNESNLWPVMGTLEFQVGKGGPYVGGGAGWEFLNVQAYDTKTGLAYSADYDGFGYQVFGGMRLPLGPKARLSGEVYWNGAKVDRQFFDPISGNNVVEEVNVDGAGGRAGLSFAF